MNREMCDVTVRYILSFFRGKVGIWKLMGITHRNFFEHMYMRYNNELVHAIENIIASSVQDFDPEKIPISEHVISQVFATIKQYMKSDNIGS